MVYDQLWKCKNSVAAYHAPTRTGILAYYDGTVLDETDVTTMREDGWDELHKNWRPGSHAGLPQWLLANKQMLEEGMEQFRLKAHWIVWSLVPAYELERHEKLADAMIMSPKYARRLSLDRMMLVLTEDRPFSIWFRYDSIVSFKVQGGKAQWLTDLIESLGELPAIQQLKVAIEFPSMSFHRDRGKDLNKRPFEVEVRLPEYFGKLVEACKKIQTLEVELFHSQYDKYGEFSGEVLDMEALQHFPPIFRAAMGENVTETRIATPSSINGGYLNNAYIKHRQLLDWKLIYTRKQS